MPDERNVSRGWKLTACIAAALILLTVAWILLTRLPHAATPALTTAARSQPPASKPSAPPQAVSPGKPEQPAHPAPTTATEICGLGRPPIEPGEINQYVETKTHPAYERWETALLNSSDLRSRAVGLIMRERGELVSHELAVQVGEARDELVQLAAGSDDPMVYGLAVGQCQKELLMGIGDSGACGRISLSRWARLDPDNATPWLALAQAAHKAGNSEEEVSAVAQAAQAQEIGSPGQSILSLAQSEMPQDLTPLEKAAIAIDFIGVEAAWTMPVYSEATRYCSVDAVRQDETRAECDSLANLLVNRGVSLIDFSIGRRLGERVGWPSERLSELAQERAELFKLVPAADANFWSCERLARANLFFAKRMESGELQALRYFKDNPSR